MKTLFTILTVVISSASFAQTTFWTESFGTGCARGTLATAYTGSNGPWTQTNGTNQTYANLWFVSATAAGTAVNTCAGNCTQSNVTNQTLHIGNPTITIFTTTVLADTGATYLTGLFCGSGYCSTTDRRIESPTINCTNRTSITVSFLYFENGETTNDDATFWFYNGSAWLQTNALAKTPLGPCGAAGQWIAIVINLPAAANNNPNVKIGFKWVNNDDGLGNDPSFAVDDIVVAGLSTIGIGSIDLSYVNVFAAGKDITIQNADDFNVKGVYDIVGKAVAFERHDNVLSTDLPFGIYFVELEISGQRLVRKVMIR